MASRSLFLSFAALILLAVPAVGGAAPNAGEAPPSLSVVEKSLTEGNRAASYLAPATGFLTVRSAAPDGGDWDLDLLDARTGRTLSGSHGFGSHEVAQTYVTAGQRVTARGSRLGAGADQLEVTFEFFEAPLPKSAGTPQLFSVAYQDDADLERIEAAGLDLTHQISDGRADVIVTGAGELASLRQLGLPFEVEIPNLTQHYASARAADSAAVAAAGSSALPSGREEYRVLQDYQDELKALAEENPGLVKPLVLPKRTFQGREIMGVEIAEDVDRTDDGRPTYFVMGMHHAREWPSAEAAIEFAHLLVQGAGSDDRISDLLERERVVVVPIVNVDGFVESREGGALGLPDPADTTGSEDLQLVEGVAPPGGSFAYRRKNCNGAIPSGSVPCTLQWGIDPNRNYGNGWGGPGAGTDPVTQSYRGPGPFSEPETQAIWEFARERQVTTTITLHNVAALVLRPPGLSDAGKAPDEEAMKALGDAMGAAAGYESQYGFQLYDTSGTTDDYTYAAQGSYSYTIEIGPAGGDFHMPYQTGVVDEWTGKPGTPTEGKGLREALLLAAENAAAPEHHAVIEGKAKRGTLLRIRKDFVTETSAPCAYAQGYLNTSGGATPLDCFGELDMISIPDKLESTMTVPNNGKFEWHVLPSTRPFVGARVEGGEPEPAGDPTVFTPTVEENKLALGAVDDEEGSVEREFTLDGTADAVQVDLTWDVQAEDYDLYLFRVLQNGDRVAAGDSGNPPGIYEQEIMTAPVAGDYVLKVVYFATAANDWKATIQPLVAEPEHVVSTGVTESFTLTCETAAGEVLATEQITVARGERLDLDKPCKDNPNSNPNPDPDPGPGTKPPTAGKKGPSAACKKARAHRKISHRKMRRAIRQRNRTRNRAKRARRTRVVRHRRVAMRRTHRRVKRICAR